MLPGRHADADSFARWAADLAGGVPGEARAAHLEVRALLERLSLQVTAPVPDQRDHPAGDRHARWVAAMAAFLATRFREPIGVAEPPGAWRRRAVRRQVV